MNRYIKPLTLASLILIICTISIFSSGKNSAQDISDTTLILQSHEEEHPTTNDNEIHAAPNEEHAEEQHGVESESHEGGHGSNMYPLLFVIIALLIGAATRYFFRRSPLPYTVTLLLIGLGLGAANRLGWFGEWNLGLFTMNMDFLHQSLNWAGKIDAHLILFVFLPTLIFEAAFAMDVHTFKKSLTNATLLAVPGIIMALLLTGVIIMGMKGAGLGFSQWGWAMALLFGTVISATDPVAVVALLKDLGASKKLATLIEGESLLNDGTAIVIFSVLLVSFTGDASDTSPILEFLRVAIGGLLVGLFFGWLTIRWVKKVFNDALIEITAIIAAAYLTFFVAEYFLHVSGVLGLVALGLIIGGVGRTRISPEVEHFLHEFWEMAAFIANTLIFIIVGVVIANRTVFTGKDILNLFIIYIGIHLVRAIVITILYPLMRKAGYGLPVKNAYVLWYGALRGAIGLALALMVSVESNIAQEIRDDFLFYTAGIVTLTLLINATTIKILVNKLGLTKVAPAKALMMAQTQSYLRTATENAIEKFKKDRYLNKAHWDEVREYLPVEAPPGSGEEMQLESKIAEARRRILEREKSSYWTQFKEGMLGAMAVQKLTDAINEIMDEGGLVSLSKRKDLENEWRTPKFLGRIQSMPIVGKPAQKLFFERLVTSYDSARGFVFAQEENMKLLENMAISSDENEGGLDIPTLNLLEEEINENRIHGLTFLRNLKTSYPEIYNAIATRQAIRSVLNHEKRMVDRLRTKGRIDSGEAHKIISGIEERMKILIDSPPSLEIPKPLDLLQDISWLKGLDEKIFNRVVAEFKHRVYAVDATLVKENGPDNEMIVVVRGKVKVIIADMVVDVLGPGSVIGEMAILTGMPRTATVQAESPVTVLWMSKSKLKSIIKDSPDLENRLWKFASMRFAMNLLGKEKPYNEWEQREFSQWISAGELGYPDDKGHIYLKERICILVSGTARSSDGTTTLFAPSILETEVYIFSSDALVFMR